MIPTVTIGDMNKRQGKNQSSRKASSKEAPKTSDKEVVYIEVPPALKKAMQELAKENDRTLTGECTQAIKEYLKLHKRWPLVSGDAP